MSDRSKCLLAREGTCVIRTYARNTYVRRKDAAIDSRALAKCIDGQIHSRLAMPVKLKIIIFACSDVFQRDMTEKLYLTFPFFSFLSTISISNYNAILICYFVLLQSFFGRDSLHEDLMSAIELFISIEMFFYDAVI